MIGMTGMTGIIIISALLILLVLTGTIFCLIVIRKNQKRQRHIWDIAFGLRRPLDYQTIGKQLLIVDELPQGSYARYAKDETDEKVESK